MGNIWLLLILGKKIYICEDTSMWQHFRQDLNLFMYPVSELGSITLEQLAYFPEEQAYNNIHIAEEYTHGNHVVPQWRKVFED
ncbi:MAG: hypothetical protein IJP54_01910 [Synergistaceae bacterium]|nr:hypothetical protein [Synergistaceae bacterium]